eukprot:GFUD01139896.1.p1 GENE.GFUD01139896.1~~GFUD01139896.1.p1  ORF type:complete len:457 (+),score=101.89 GFUD01139896.1:159-1373(+)
MAMQSLWSEGFDYTWHLSGWLKSLSGGDYEAMKRHIWNLDKDQVGKLLERREPLLGVSAIFHAVIGCASLHEDNPALENVEEDQDGHMRILRKLLELGLRVDVHDVAGNTCTPLRHCFSNITNFTNPRTKEVVQTLLRAGADPSSQNRYGLTPLFECVKLGQLDFISLLLKHGADPHVKEFEAGFNVVSLASAVLIENKEEVLFMLGKMNKSKCKTARSQDIVLGKCNVCQVGDGKMKSKRCTGCFLVWYCGEQCQSKDWSEHRVSCKETRAKYVPVIITDLGEEEQTSIVEGKVYVHRKGDKPSKTHFVVKVQVPEVQSLKPGEESGALKVYNKDKSMCGYLYRGEQERVYGQLMKDIKEKGMFGGTKAFFYAVYTENEIDLGNMDCFEIKINTTQMMPPEKW